MYLADTLSRAYLLEMHTCAVTEELKEIDHTLALASPIKEVRNVATWIASDFSFGSVASE